MSMLPIVSTSKCLERALLGLQAFQVAFLWVHDWLPLGRLNDIAAVRRRHTLGALVAVTLVQSVPFTIGLYYSAESYGKPHAPWLVNWLWISYGILLAGQIRAWWIPYLFKPEPARAERFEEMFGNTHAFLPKRNGIVPNTAHFLLHAATAGTLLVLFLRKWEL